MSRRLVVVPDSARVEQWLIDETQRVAFVDLRGVCAFASLLEQCAPAARLADPLWERMLIGRLAEALAVPAFGASARSAEFSSQVHDLLNELYEQGVTFAQLEAAGRQLEGAARSRTLSVVALWRELEAQLTALGVVPRSAHWSLAAKHLKQAGLPASLRGYQAIELRHVHDVSVARLQFLEALASACAGAGVEMVWHWPASGQVSTDAFIVNAIRDVEAKWQHLPVEVLPDVSSAPLAWLGGVAFAEDGEPRAAPSLQAFCAPSTREELREIGRRVRRLVSAGVPPERIGIAFRDLGGDVEAIAEALEGFDLPIRAHRGQPLLSSLRGRLAFSVLQWEDDGFPAEAMATLLESELTCVLPSEAAPPRGTFREAGVRNNTLGASASEGAYAVRLAAHARRSGQTHRRVELLSVAVQRVILLCQSIPAEASAQVLFEKWSEAVLQLGLLQAPRSLHRHAPFSSLMAEEVGRALSRDARAVEALNGFLVRFQSALTASGLGRHRFARADFARWLRQAASGVWLPMPGPRAAAVPVLDVRELPGRQFEYLFVGGLLDGRFPGRVTPSAVLNDDERSALNRAARAPLFRTGVGEGDIRLPSRLAEDRLLFHLALSAAENVTLSRARFDDAGRELLASPFIDAVARYVLGWHEETIHRSAVPPLPQVEHETELRLRAALEAGRPTALALVVQSEPWFQRVTRVNQMEVERLRFFADATRPPGPFSGLVDGEVRQALEPRLRFDAARPLSAHELETWGNCAFRGLGSHVLGLTGDETTGEELEPRARGTFWHEALALVVPRLQEAGLVGKPSAEVVPLLKRAIAESAQTLEKKEATGHPALWALAQEWAVSVLARVLSGSDAVPFAGARPKYFEISFGEASSLSALQQVKIPSVRTGEFDVFLRGRMDRVDVGDFSVGVLDYKTNVSRTLSKDFLHREFQMAFYLLAAQQLSPGIMPTGAWLGLGRAELRSIASVLQKGTVEELLATDELSRARAAREGRFNLANAVHALLGALRQGYFAPRPIDCTFCALKPVCRISQRQLPEEGA